MLICQKSRGKGPLRPIEANPFPVSGSIVNHHSPTFDPAAVLVVDDQCCTRHRPGCHIAPAECRQRAEGSKYRQNPYDAEQADP